MEALQVAENKVREAIASPLADGWKEPEAEKEEEKKPKLGGPTAAALETKVYEKIIGQSKEKLDLRLAKASIEIEKPAKHVFDIIWDVNGYKVWDPATVSTQKVVQELEPNKTQILHIQHKTLSAASAKRDLVLIRSWKAEADGGFLIWATSTTASQVPKDPNYIRAEVLFSGFLIQNLGPAKCRVTAVSVMDFGAWIHEKFIEQESVRVAQRLTKIKQRAG